MGIAEWISTISEGNAAGKWFLGRYIQTEAALIYLALLKLAHRLIMYLVGLAVALFAISVGISFLLMFFASSAENLGTAALIVLVLFVFLPVVVIFILLSHKMIIKVFGAEKLIESVKKTSCK